MIRRKYIRVISCCAIALFFTACGIGNNIPHKGELVISDALKQKEGNVELSEIGDEADTVQKHKVLRSEGEVSYYEDGTVVVGDRAYEQYRYSEDVANQYTDIINHVAQKLGEDVSVYSIVAPTSIGITLPDNKKKEIGSSNQGKALELLGNMFSDNVTFIPLYENFMQHRSEYIYFRTDHHWTGLGAYYAYNVFCRMKRVVPNELESYKKVSYGDFLGSFYQSTNKLASLKKDEFTVYYPLCNDNTTLRYTDMSGEKRYGFVITDATGYAVGLKYSVFIEGDNPYTVIHNKNLTDGSSCIVIKDSYGNAVVPFLTDHYQNIYVIDFRYWEGKLSRLIRAHHVKDVIFINNISTTRSPYLVGKMAALEE